METQRYLLRDNSIRQNCITAIQQLPTDSNKPLQVTIQEDTRSLAQNRMLWACLHDISQQVVWYGRKLDSESWKNIFSAAQHQQDTVPGINGGFVVLGKSTSKMRVSEMRDLVEIIFAFGAEQGVKWKSDTWREYEQFQAR